MTNSHRFGLALEQMKGSDWARFEQLASEFLAREFTNLRTVATTSGDGGRDSELFVQDGIPKVLLQYSVTESWEQKIEGTANLIKKNFPKARVLIYVTNQQIGAKGDSVKARLSSKHRLILDIRDKSWFLERVNASEQNSAAAESLAEEFVDRLLRDRKIIDQSSQLLSDSETRAAHLYLTLQLEDQTRDKGLTRLSFEAIICSILRETTTENKLTRQKIREQARRILSSHRPEQVDQYLDVALAKMEKKQIRHWQSSDEFCLSHDERVRLSEAVAKHDHERSELRAHIISLLTKHVGSESQLGADALNGLCLRVERIIERYLNQKGERFATSVMSDKVTGVATEDLNSVVVADLSENDTPQLPPKVTLQLVIDTIVEVLRYPVPEFGRYLRSVADTYTLLAFLRETPDVQNAVKKMFSHGEIWLDTSVVLPLFAETLLDDESRRYYTRMLDSAQKVGIKLMVIEGICEEVNGHLNLCLACSRSSSKAWRGSVPLLFSIFVMSGRGIDTFPAWIETFIGDRRPVDDICNYLRDFHHIETGSLDQESHSADVELRGHVQEVWREAHERRRYQKGRDIPEDTLEMLIRHDVENYLGTIFKRKGEKTSPLGYSAWWLTLDSTAHRMESLLRQRSGLVPPPSPVMSLDFLADYLTFGPLRWLQNASDYDCPVYADRTFVDVIPSELIDVATQARQKAAGLPEHVIKRRVRDELEAAKRRIGVHAEGGTDLMRRTIEDAFADAPIEG